MTELLMTNVPTWQFGFVIMVASIGLTLACTSIVRRSGWYDDLDHAREFVGVMYPMIGAIYGVVLAFTIVLSWERFDEAEKYSNAEVTHLSSLWRNVDALCESNLPIYQALQGYVGSVINHEWGTMARNGTAHTDTNQRYRNLWASVRNVVAAEADSAFFSSALAQMTEVGIHRRMRLNSATSEVALTVWVFLCLGGIVTVAIPLILKVASPAVHLSLNAAMAFIVVFSLWIVAAMQYPYSGDLRVSEQPFRELQTSFKNRLANTMKCTQ